MAAVDGIDCDDPIDRDAFQSRGRRCRRIPHGGVYGTVRYRLSDGRTVGITEWVPSGVISPDGKWVVMPETQERVEIQGP